MGQHLIALRGLGHGSVGQREAAFGQASFSQFGGVHSGLRQLPVDSHASIVDALVELPQLALAGVGGVVP